MITTLKTETEWPSKNEIKVINALKTVCDIVSVLYIVTEQFKEVTILMLLKPFHNMYAIYFVDLQVITLHACIHRLHVLPCHLFVVIHNKKFCPVCKVLSSTAQKAKMYRDKFGATIRVVLEDQKARYLKVALKVKSAHKFSLMILPYGNCCLV